MAQNVPFDDIPKLPNEFHDSGPLGTIQTWFENISLELSILEVGENRHELRCVAVERYHLGVSTMIGIASRSLCVLHGFVPALRTIETYTLSSRYFLIRPHVIRTIWVMV